MSGKQFYERVKGPMNNYEDWYSYRIEDGKVIVTHTWDHVSPSLAKSSGSNEYSLKEFFEEPSVHSGATSALRDVLKEIDYKE